ncbi:hypothetical protein D7X55_26925 [Corallococcus sp. AB049A]|uniref:Secreted protein n=2 Tax=Corallococcus interemptor TaxID=2316720 RepID=A0A3A8QP89_9BACT|nr:hypothetical protein [Corallococcus sp. AB049A]RKH49124.1 hypothetical protein D7Y23_18055 [Corallococcus sp. AB050B]RKH70589.1 hypothetical protein D7X96_11190 [Corallococcus interemptor]RKI58429.1 hypothetical protein D7X55_26925 [Corallococcus sp. AB049A]
MRKRVAGAVLALALVGALSASMASGVDRVRRKKPPRPSEPPPQAHREKPVHTSSPTLLASARSVALPAHGMGTWELPAREPHDSRHVPVKSQVTVTVTASSSTVLTRGQEADSTAPQPTVLPATARIPAPLHVSWRVVDASADTVRLVARLDRGPGFTAPVQVSLRVPPRTVLREGPTSPIVVDGDTKEVPWTLGLPAGSSPDDDLVLLASAGGESFGVHAEARYHFGRTLAESPLPTPAGPPLPDALMRSRE